MTDCPNGEIRDLLPDYLHGRLSAARRDEVQRHLAECAECREELSLLRDLQAALQRAAPTVDVARIASAIAPYRAPVRRSWGAKWGVAAAIVAVAVGGTAIAMLHDDAPATANRTVADVGPYVRPAPDLRSGATPLPAESATHTARVERTPSVSEPARGGESQELAMAGGAIGELSDAELSNLVEEIESLDAVPSAEVESVEPMSVEAREGS